MPITQMAPAVSDGQAAASWYLGFPPALQLTPVIEVIGNTRQAAI